MGVQRAYKGTQTFIRAVKNVPAATLYIFQRDEQYKKGNLRPGQERIYVLSSIHLEGYRLINSFIIGQCGSCIFHN
jgi:hypothetical protein